MTEVPNRRHFDESFERCLALGRRTASSTGLVSVDLDRFKEINDKYGHLEGDRILRYVAGVLSSCVRRSDVVARYGGDEFVIMLPGESEAGIRTVADKIITHFADSPYTSKSGETLHLSLSLGGAYSPVHGADPEKLFVAADQALFEAKRSGRGRLVVADVPAAGHDFGESPTQLRQAQ